MRRKIINLLTRINVNLTQAYKRAVIRFFYKNILINRQTYIGKSTKIVALKGAIVDIRGVWIKEYSLIYADENAEIVIGDKAQVGRFNTIVAKQKIYIGERTLLAEFVTIRDQDHDLYDLNKFEVIPIKIGNDVWIANKTTIVKGVNIGSKTVIGANSVVTRNIIENAVAVGSPARVIKSL
jgi:acetyltransferase-like isoleucine patch superfamily enzyme